MPRWAFIILSNSRFIRSTKPIKTEQPTLKAQFQHKLNLHKPNKHYKPSIVSLAYAVVEEFAVMVEIMHAFVAG